MAHNFTDLAQVAAALRSTPHVLRALLLPLDDAALEVEGHVHGDVAPDRGRQPLDLVVAVKAGR